MLLISRGKFPIIAIISLLMFCPSGQSGRSGQMSIKVRTGGCGAALVLRAAWPVARGLHSPRRCANPFMEHLGPWTAITCAYPSPPRNTHIWAQQCDNAHIPEDQRAAIPPDWTVDVSGLIALDDSQRICHITLMEIRQKRTRTFSFLMQTFSVCFSNIF